MGFIVRHSNLEQQNKVKYGEINGASSDVLSTQGNADLMREELLNKYGWQSPSEYYYGSSSNDMGSKASDMTPSMGEITDYEIASLEEGSDYYLESADRDVIPDWFWVDSLDNWCYFKITDDMTEFRKVSPRFGDLGNTILSFASFGILNVIDEIQKGNWLKGLATGLSTMRLYYDAAEASVEIIAGVSDFFQGIISKVYTTVFGDGIFGNALAVVNNLNVALSMKMLRAANDLYQQSEGVLSLPLLLYYMFLTDSSVDHEDVESEEYIEMVATGGPENNMPRNCISLYMWNGYKRNWMPMKRMIEIYDTFGKRSNYDLIYSSLKNMYPKLVSATDDEFSLYLETFGIPVENASDGFNRLRNEAFDIRNRTSGNYFGFLNQMTGFLMRECPQAVNSLARMLFMNIYAFDPACIESLQLRSPLNKKHVLWVDNGDEHSWSQAHWLENWSMWIPLPRDKAKIKLYNKNTFQLINRPVYQLNWFGRDLVGFEHKNIGHPCFMRGNDDILWICYWQRWTSTRGEETEGGGIFDKIIEVEGIQDIYKSDVENWTAIRSSMFEKHDDYGFDDWMINGNYLLSNHRFTIDEESPTTISTYEESTIGPDRVAPVNSIDKVNKNKLVLSLSSGTVISRDDDNGILDVAKRWR